MNFFISLLSIFICSLGNLCFSFYPFFYWKSKVVSFCFSFNFWKFLLKWKTLTPCYICCNIFFSVCICLLILHLFLSWISTSFFVLVLLISLNAHRYNLIFLTTQPLQCFMSIFFNHCNICNILHVHKWYPVM